MNVWWLLSLALGAWLYSWTFTRHGRIEFFPAFICRAASLSARLGSAITYSEVDRQSANSQARRMMQLPITATIEQQDISVDTAAGELALRIYGRTGAKNAPVILNIHGGAWWMGNDYIDEGIMRHLCELSGAVIVSVDYRLAPEHPYPAALDDCYDALLWLERHIARYGGDPTRIIVHGTSAGGGLASSLCLLTGKRGGPQPIAQVLIVPVTDLSGEHWGDSMRELSPGYILTAPDFEDMIANFVPDEQERRSPFVSPVYADDLAELPPAFIATAQFDPLRDQGANYAGLLEGAGVELEYHCHPRVIHGFLGSKPVMLRNNEQVAAFISRLT